ncbi:MAG TPA: SRPBCC domain-containing protein [Microbacterium sp.]|uniref:SRPBCC domain-containing protein n=1 Tax=Microbacterium sp. TaxID=51671 RepID=UPI002C7CEF51|nr:SRPBCC domain-containing protein [Microbacterium sp.]HWI30838.1 SRPBCC domain-containing protein [Microbacterium sp.]
MRVDSASRLIAVPPGTIFRAFVEPDLLGAWLPPEGMTGRLERFDPVVGGGFRMVLTYESAEGRGKFDDGSDVADTRIVRLEHPTAVVWEVDFPSEDPAFSGTMTMTWSFAAGEAGTLVTVRATDVPDGIDPHDHAVGLASSLAQLEKAVLVA